MSIPEKSQMSAVPAENTIIERLAFEPNTGCELWTGRALNGYGAIWRHGVARYVHRLRWEELHGQIPRGLFVCHRCDTPLCCNLDHLFLGSHRENMADMVRKGRSARGSRHPVSQDPSRVRGERNGRAKLNAEQVDEIRAMRKSGKSCVVVAAIYGISFSQVSRIARGESWATCPKAKDFKKGKKE